MSPNFLSQLYENAKKKSEPEGATNTAPALEHSDPRMEDRIMSRCGYNGDSTPKDNTSWKSIGDLARKIVEGQVNEPAKPQ